MNARKKHYSLVWNILNTAKNSRPQHPPPPPHPLVYELISDQSVAYLHVPGPTTTAAIRTHCLSTFLSMRILILTGRNVHGHWLLDGSDPDARSANNDISVYSYYVYFK